MGFFLLGCNPNFKLIFVNKFRKTEDEDEL